MLITPWGVELSENIQNLQIDQVEDKKKWSKKMKKVEKRMKGTNPYISLGIRYGRWIETAWLKTSTSLECVGFGT